MKSRKKVEIGDIVAIPLEENLVAVGIILHESKRFKDAIMIGYYDQPFTTIAEIDIEKLGGNFIDSPNYTSKKAITHGPWRIVGNSKDLLELATIPHLRVASHVYYKDTIVHHFDSVHSKELKKYPPLTGQGRIFVENKLRDYFLTRQ